ncbi:cobyrinic acid a,c-diamide synthase [Chlorobaculum parvum NCIB 8327]|uniref:Cobyrinate a,c-diamide synthase n=1 Tax=Chlorobaculum parvum (strain DSM 263 / NCIMB 8327) TaxID=517417 RepID=B3QNU4_CHLP8|nr:cobyrinate a,c-diamide synthase [Chlorobaculum parvum]ACF11597.1 cobyrinic acid a,c-diamide synthase [Chlorobaculum parvum NCIB 8327]
MKSNRGFLIAAPSSGSGKTTITLGLLRLFARRGMEVQPFKCGPDYLDTMLHAMAASTGEASKPGLNLDTFMASKEHVRSLFASHAASADISMVEGVMGLFDGAERSNGSSAEIATLLGLPVIMVIDGSKMAYSAAPILYGFKNFDPSVNVAGVIFNRVGSASHYSYLEAAAKDVGVEPLGYLPRNSAITIDERHLGLNTSAEYDREKLIDAMADHIEKTVNIERLLEVARIELPEVEPIRPVAKKSGKMIAVARDEAFNFIYHANIEALKQYGEVRFFSPLHDHELPEADLVYLAGGYPELHARALAANAEMRNAIAEWCRNGGATYAECGGLMYLGQTLTLADGATHPMCGVLDLDTTMQEARLTLGYRKVYPADANGVELRGHEFHYSRISRQGEIDTIAEIRNARDQEVPTSLFRVGNTIASYLHLYWGERDHLANWFF